jgi:hypothetical protein
MDFLRPSRAPGGAKQGLLRRHGGNPWAFALVNRLLLTSSPDGIRTRATALRGRRARPLHNGALARPGPTRGRNRTAEAYQLR